MKRRFLSIIVVVALLVTTQSVTANSFDIETRGRLGANVVHFSLGRSDHGNLYQYKCYIRSEYRVEEMGVTNINVVTQNGGGRVNASKVLKNVFTLSYGTATYTDYTKSCNARFYVKSDNFGSVSRLLYSN